MAELLVHHFISISFHWKQKGKYLYEIWEGGGGGRRNVGGILVMGNTMQPVKEEKKRNGEKSDPA